MDEIISQLREVKNVSSTLLAISQTQREKALLTLAKLLREFNAQIIAENKKDLALLSSQDPKFDRLLLNKERINAIANDVESVVKINFSPETILSETVRPNGLRIQKVSTPIGVVGIIYESRPNVTVDVFSLCFKTANACVLKGGKEAYYSNQILVSLIQKALSLHHISTQAIYLLPPNREAAAILLEAVGLIDVCIPRGSQSLIDFVRNNAKIPVIETGAGIVHTYFDQWGDLENGKAIITNAKTRRVSVCNALDALVIHKDCLAVLPQLLSGLSIKNVEIYADSLSYHTLFNLYPTHLLYQAKAEDFGREFLDYKMAVKTVNSLDEALAHIKKYSSGHSEAIITEREESAQKFVKQVDAAAVYVNTSTAFTDGGQFGLGAEIGISTQKLHARGPMGLDALMSYKWIVWGNGQTRN